jgi:hypothetical protein
MSGREFLGGFELLVLLALVRLGEEAYGVPISEAIEQSSGRSVSIGRRAATGERQGMKVAEPPHLANWLLEHLTSGPQRESLIGDLYEQLARGRSPRWFWRQAVATIALTASQEIRSHRLLALRGLALSMAVFYFVRIPTSALGQEVNRLLLARTPQWVAQYRLHELFRMVLTFESYVVIGWIIAAVDPQHRVTSVLALLAYLCLFAFPRYAFTAAVIAPTHQGFAWYLAIEFLMLMAAMWGTLRGAFGMGQPRRRLSIVVR